jgi:hypothetical protein
VRQTQKPHHSLRNAGLKGYLAIGDGPNRPEGSLSPSRSVVVRGNDLPGTVRDIGILPGSTYWFETVTMTRSGIEVDNNKGNCYWVTVPTS